MLRSPVFPHRPDPSRSTPSLISASPNLQPSSHTLASTSLSQMVPPLISASQVPSHIWGTSSLPDVPPLVSAVPSSPPALVSSNLHDRSPYTLCFITGNIRVCRGCRQKYTKPCTPLMDLCVRHHAGVATIHSSWGFYCPVAVQKRVLSLQHPLYPSPMPQFYGGYADHSSPDSSSALACAHRRLSKLHESDLNFS